MFQLWLFVAIVTLHLLKVTKPQMPEATRQGLRNAKTLEEFQRFIALDNNTDMMADFQRQQYGISNRCDLNETCIFIPVCVPIEPDLNDNKSEYFPRCVKLTRCVDSSHDHDKHCHRTIASVNVTVLHYYHIASGQGTRMRTLQKENHSSCYLENGLPPVKNNITKLHSSPPLPISTTSFTPLTSNCTSFNQCPGNSDGVKEQKRNDCNECEIFDSDCCSCLCQGVRDENDICTC
jgi:hypothetical protein